MESEENMQECTVVYSITTYNTDNNNVGCGGFVTGLLATVQHYSDEHGHTIATSKLQLIYTGSALIPPGSHRINLTSVNFSPIV